MCIYFVLGRGEKERWKVCVGRGMRMCVHVCVLVLCVCLHVCVLILVFVCPYGRDFKNILLACRKHFAEVPRDACSGNSSGPLLPGGLGLKQNSLVRTDISTFVFAS